MLLIGTRLLQSGSRKFACRLEQNLVYSRRLFSSELGNIDSRTGKAIVESITPSPTLERETDTTTTNSVDNSQSPTQSTPNVNEDTTRPNFNEYKTKQTDEDTRGSTQDLADQHNLPSGAWSHVLRSLRLKKPDAQEETEHRQQIDRDNAQAVVKWRKFLEDGTKNSRLGEVTSAAVSRACMGNMLIAVCKGSAFFASGSSAMLAETIHSLVDVANEICLWVGLQQVSKQCTRTYNFGFGRSAFFWSLVSALGTFWLGAGVTFFHAVEMLLHPPTAIQVGWETWSVLALSFAVDGWVLQGVLRALSANAKESGQSMRNYLTRITDPLVIAVMFEDMAACAGVLVALCGISMSHYTGNVMWDVGASLIISGVLGTVGMYLALFNYRFLVGKAVDPAVEARICEIISQQRSIDNVFAVQSCYTGPRSFTFKAEVDFDGTWLSTELNDYYVNEFLRASARGQLAKRTPLLLAFHAEDITRLVEKEVQDIESKIRMEFPEATFIDIEPDSSQSARLKVSDIAKRQHRVREYHKLVSLLQLRQTSPHHPPPVGYASGPEVTNDDTC